MQEDPSDDVIYLHWQIAGCPDVAVLSNTANTLFLI